MARRQRSDSTTALIKRHQQSKDELPTVPKQYIELAESSDEFILRYQQLSEVRSVSEWKRWELIQVCKICEDELFISRLRKDLYISPTIEYPNGTVTGHPHFKMIEALEKLNLSRIRAIGLTDSKQQARNSTGVIDTTASRKDSPLLAKKNSSLLA